MSVRLEIDGPVATLTIDRPAKRNAMSFEMWSALPVLLGEVEADESVRALVVRGTDHFSAGAGISEFSTLRADPAGAPPPPAGRARGAGPRWRRGGAGGAGACRGAGWGGG